MKTQTTIAIDGADYEVSQDFLSHILATAVEGGCSYWADVSPESSGDVAGSDGARDFDVSDYVDENSDDAGEVFYTSASFVASGDSTQGGTLDLQGVADAIERIASGEVEVAPAIREIVLHAVREEDPSDIDAEVSDCIVQVGLFDEIVFS
jgi:hypothetical protein